MTALFVILGVLAGVLALPILAEALRKPMTSALQNRAPGRLVDLSQGTTHFRWHGPETGPVAICIHGLSTPSYVFAATERSLASLGYRVLSYDLYGRGYSDRARGAQSAAFFCTQLKDLIRSQNIDGEVTLLGFSMGAQIAAAYAAENAGRVRSLILVAPAGVSKKTMGSASSTWQAPLIGDWLTRVMGGWMLRRELVEHRSIATVVPDLEDRQAAETRMRGFLPALLSSRRHLLSKYIAPDLDRIELSPIRVLAIWGTDDPIVPLSAMGEVARVLPEAHHAQISGAGHNLLQTHPAQIAAQRSEFLKR